MQNEQCQTCHGRGVIGGFVSAESGYQDDPCPDCTISQPAIEAAARAMAALRESAEILRQMISEEQERTSVSQAHGAECERLKLAATAEQDGFIARIVALEDERDILAEKLRAAEATYNQVYHQWAALREKDRQQVGEVMGRLRGEMGSMVVNLPADYWIRKLDAALTELGAEEAGK